MTTTLQSRWRKRIEHRRHHQRHTHIRIVGEVQAVEFWRSNSKNGYRLFVDEDRLTDNGWVFCEASVPKSVTQDNDRMGSGSHIIFLSEEAPRPRPDSQHLKEVSTYKFAPNAIIMITVAHVRLCTATCDDSREELPALISQVLIHRIREGILNIRILRIIGRHYKQLFRAIYRQTLKQYLVCKSKHCSVGTNAQRQCECHNQSKRRILRQHAEGVTNVGNGGRQHKIDLGLWTLVLGLWPLISCSRYRFGPQRPKSKGQKPSFLSQRREWIHS